jgi:hypothetical protein
MTDLARPLHHHDTESTDDDALAREARAHYLKHPSLQVVAETIAALREAQVPWWSPEDLRSLFNAQERLRWFRERADLRQRITTTLTGLPKNAARSRGPAAQAELIDAVLDHGDVSASDFEAAFEPDDIVVYGPVATFWTAFRDRMPWNDSSVVHQKLIARLLRSLLSERSADGSIRRPILTPWDVRSSIDGTVWHRSLPIELLVAIDDARLKQERARPREPFHARHELMHVNPDQLVSHVQLVEIEPVFTTATTHMRFEGNDALVAEPDSGTRSLAPASLSLAPNSMSPAALMEIVGPKIAVNG